MNDHSKIDVVRVLSNQDLFFDGLAKAFGMMTGPHAVTAESQQVREAFEKITGTGAGKRLTWRGQPGNRFEICPLVPRSIGS
ncbi:hypothetical protein [Marinobacter psychrophilus]|uniref:hypothetical protein n=1 Tax=Marinobacter psychrophilus TaxID=330734 RepID=UPI001B66175B|nr:hypothetical protein [Marinobacter psychrophilus]MBQ0764432.1 hypothetical protein [Marinobacter psychrophilus]MBQ0846283.1 hypothetical protein [Marinobacter psychrophilus]